VGIEADSDFDNGFACTFGEFPLVNGTLRRVGENGVAAENFDVLHGAVWLYGNFHADDAADAPAFENRGILRFDFFDNAARSFLRVRKRTAGENEERAKQNAARNGATTDSAHLATFKAEFP